MKLKKIAMFILIVLIAPLCFLQSTPIFYADNQLLKPIISPLYLEDAEFSLDLENISYFDINSKFIVFATSDDSNITILNRHNKNINTTLDVGATINYIKLTSKYLFVSVLDDEHNHLKVYDISTLQPTELYKNLQSSTTMQIENFQYISIVETSLNKTNYILVATTVNDRFAYYYFTEQLHQQYSGEIATSGHPLADYNLTYVGLSNASAAYVVGVGSGGKRLFKITIQAGTQTTVADGTMFTPNDAFTSIVVVQNTIDAKTTDYIVTVDASFTRIIKTNTPIENDDESEIIWSRGNESLVDNSYKKGKISNPKDVKFFNDKIYISDTITKSIQSFTLELEIGESSPLRLAGDKVVVASFCSETGRFNPNSQLAVSENNQLFVADTENKRLQHIYKNHTSLHAATKVETPEGTVANSVADDNYVYYSLNSTTLVRYNILTEETKAYTENPPNIFSIAAADNQAFVVADGVLLQLADDKVTTVPTALTEENFNESTIIAYLPTAKNLVLYNGGAVLQLDTSGNQIGKAAEVENVKALTVDAEDNIYLLIDDEIVKYTIEDNAFKETNSITSDRFSQYYSMAIDRQSGILYAFNNNTCGLEIIAHPEFNLLAHPIQARTTTTGVSVFERPSGLNNPELPRIVLADIHTYLNLYSIHPVYKDGNRFFVVKTTTGSGYGYVNVNDVYFDDEQQIVKNLPHFNARVNILDYLDTVDLLASPAADAPILITLQDNHRIFAYDFNKDNPYTRVRVFVDNKEINGYIPTKYVAMNQLDDNQYTALIILAAAIFLALVLVVFYGRSRR